MRCLILALTALVLTVTCVSAEPPRLPPGISCEFVRAKVAEHGKAIAYAWARLQGYSKRDIAEAKRCLRQ